MDTLFPIPKKEDLNHNLDIVKTYPINNYHKNKYDIFIGRGSEWGNPWSHLPSEFDTIKTENREIAIINYWNWIKTQPELLNKISSLYGKSLGCYCYPSFCHGDILGMIADTSMINENIINNNIFNNIFVITENQSKLLDNRRLKLLSILTTPNIAIKQKGNITGLIKIPKSIYDGNNFNGENVYLVREETRNTKLLRIDEGLHLIKVSYRDCWFLTPIFGSLDEVYIAKGQLIEKKIIN